MAILTGELKAKADKICAQYEVRRAAILPVMHLVQADQGAIIPQVEEEIAAYFGIPAADVRELMTFYTLYYPTPKGKRHVQICRTLSCALLGADDLVKHCETKLGIKAGQTTADKSVSLDAVECLGACEIAPMAKVDLDYVGPLTKDLLNDLLSGKPAPEKSIQWKK